ncbi:hypothetical protein BCR34DRAFT_607538 [Clohesyomyces aquaticus]|uniref:Xylanolytic transcriptional activator regulatory domain-containing protein n=1 Tax=Clohesyomyces aquaticus TaxID=1231657 RepID=A0A1Y1YGJ3_9PLEO|nr:hypothetical protein BCR34DRAFT_607538 [Clohesyomyces aquaticus]
MALNPDEAIQWQLPESSVVNPTDSGPQASATGNSRVCDSCIRSSVIRAVPRAHAAPRAEKLASIPLKGVDLVRSQAHIVVHQHLEPILVGRRQLNYEEPSIVTQNPSPTTSVSGLSFIRSFEAPNQEAPIRAPVDIGPTEEQHLLERYFDIVQDANPIYSKERFLSRYRNSLCDSGLISTITTITTKLTRPMSVEESATIDTRLDSLLSSSTVQENLFTDFPSLDQYRKSCVLAIYEFHQFPGHQSWVRIGILTRMAFRTGLDRLENLRKLEPEWRALSKEDMEEWRAIWWCIYRLDSYSNLSSGTPYLVSEDLIATALILCSPSQPMNDAEAPLPVLLSAYSETPWKLLPVITSHPETMYANIHNITIMMMRQVGQITRVAQLRLLGEMSSRITEVERRLAALRLALPPNWLNPKRNAFSHESHVDHHARLVTVLFLLMARLLLAILCCSGQQEEGWLMSWQQVLEICQDIASIAEQWNSLFCVKVDPAVSFIIFTALVFLDLHEKSTATSGPTLQRQIHHDKTVLRLQLEHFANIWTLPRLLSLSYATFSESIPGPLAGRHIKTILLRFEAPLHPRWLQFLSNPQKYWDKF